MVNMKIKEMQCMYSIQYSMWITVQMVATVSDPCSILELQWHTKSVENSRILFWKLRFIGL